MLARLHRDQLSGLLGQAAAEHLLVPSGTIAGRLRGYVDGATPAGISSVIEALDAHDADTLWLDGSNLGRIAQGVKRLRPRVRVIAFCHNVEARFFLGALRRDKSARATGVVISNYTAERLTIRYSDDVVALSKRDSDGLRQLYGRAADTILPMTLADQPYIPADSTEHLPANAPLLFVGSAFYANRAGITWYANNVAPRLPGITVQVVGQGMEAMRDALASAPSMHVLGSVDLLEPYYRKASAVIAPIFDGSGMKTKVAEGLMFGKRIIGAPEAFSGYAEDVISANWCCPDADAFVAAIQELGSRNLPSWDADMRALYERDHSPAAARVRMATLLGLTAA